MPPMIKSGSAALVLATISLLQPTQHSTMAASIHKSGSNCVVCLGKLSEAQSPLSYFPLGGFRRAKDNLKQLTAKERTLYRRYAYFLGGLRSSNDPDNFIETATQVRNNRTLPLTLVGGYAQNASQIVQSGDFEEQVTIPSSNPAVPSNTMSSGLTFSAIHHDLLTGKDPAQTHLNADVDAEANIIVTLICHADGMKPKSVCGRAVVKQILKHVK